MTCLKNRCLSVPFMHFHKSCLTLSDCIMTTILVSMITVPLTYSLKSLYNWDCLSHTMLTLGFPGFTSVSLRKIAVWHKREGFPMIELSREWSAYLGDLLTGQCFFLVDCMERLFCKLNTACLLHYLVGNWSNKDQGKRAICLCYIYTLLRDLPSQNGYNVCNAVR